LAVVSKRLAALEDRLGVRLINRTTRWLNPTQEGAEFFERCQRILLDLEEAEAAVTYRPRCAASSITWANICAPPISGIRDV